VVAASIAEWKATHASKKARMDDGEGEGEGEGDDESASAGGVGALKSHVELPSQAAIEKLILEKKKAEIMAKYANL